MMLVLRGVALDCRHEPGFVEAFESFGENIYSIGAYETIRPNGLPDVRSGPT